MEDKKNIVIVNNFAAIDKVVKSHLVEPTERVASGKDYVLWGKKNDYPDYISSLVRNAATLSSIISGCIDYTAGDDVTAKQLPFNAPDGKRYINRTRKSLQDFVRDLARDYFSHGGFAIEVVRANDGSVAELYNVEVRRLRANKEFDVFWYSEEWDKIYGRKKPIVYPAFTKDADRTVTNSILYWRNSEQHVYPECPFAGAIVAAELERAIDEYHWNAINNGFTGSYIINFNNGTPTDEIKKEIEKDVEQKFAGYKNANRFLLSFNNDREHMVTVQDLKSSDFSEKYDALSKRSRQQLFTAYRANPNLFGIPTENLGFSQEEFDSAFKLFNRTVIKPAQKRIIDAVQSIYEMDMQITPFSLAGDVEKTEKAEEEER